MTKMHLFCVTNIQSQNLENLNLNLAGVGKNKFSSKYLTCLEGENIQHKEEYYSELTFHYWFWKNKLSQYNENDWIGFCQKRRFWIKQKNTDIRSFKELKKNLLLDAPDEWNRYDAILCNPINLSGVKKIKMIKRGWKNLIRDPEIFFNLKKQTIKLHFDMHHGFGVLDQAINLMNDSHREEFLNFVNTNTKYNPHIMFVSKKKIIDKWFNDLFSWLFKCEKLFNFKSLKGYDSQRLYAFLGERYLSFWFKKNTCSLDWPWIFYE